MSGARVLQIKVAEQKDIAINRKVMPSSVHTEGERRFEVPIDEGVASGLPFRTKDTNSIHTSLPVSDKVSVLFVIVMSCFVRVSNTIGTWLPVERGKYSFSFCGFKHSVMIPRCPFEFA